MSDADALRLALDHDQALVRELRDENQRMRVALVEVGALLTTSRLENRDGDPTGDKMRKVLRDALGRKP